MIAATVGAKTALIERDCTGGGYLWTGCVPQEPALATADLAPHPPLRHDGRTRSGRPRPRLRRVMTHVRRVRERVAPPMTTRRPMPIAETLGYLARPTHLRRTACIALVVGIVLSTINQLTVITAGHANTATWVRCALNFVAPFIVSNLGLLTGRPPPERSVAQAPTRTLVELGTDHEPPRHP